MIKKLTVEALIQENKFGVLLDVRSPGEYEKAHIPGALNLPLFSDEERAQVGTLYKQQGREAAILLGFDLTGSKWRGSIEAALKMAPDQKVILYCWRGGMRSGIMAWALDLYGFDVTLIEGGYKRYRRWVLQQFEKEYPLIVLGGMTGSHKTDILKALEKSKEQVIDLEGLAQHQGSAFGSMNKMHQPSQEQFENNLAGLLVGIAPGKMIWVEDESRTIGKSVVPGFLWEQMQSGALIEVRIPLDNRLDYLEKEYGTLEKEFLTECTQRIQKRLGPLRTKEALAAIEENRMRDFIREVLTYYDKAYGKCLSRRDKETIFPIEMNWEGGAKSATEILKHVHSIKGLDASL